MKYNQKSKELQDIELALQQYSDKHGGNVVITVNVCAFDENDDVIDDHLWFQGSDECMKVAVESMMDEINTRITKRKIIIIESYPADMTFEVFDELPEFTFNCPVRNEILLHQLQEQNIDSPCHAYSDYGVDCIEKFDGGEVWSIGS